MRYIGDIVDINPEFDRVQIFWIKREEWSSGNKHMANPAIWIEFENSIYFGVCKSYHFNFLEDFSDWENFDEYNPGHFEFSHLMKIKPTFYKLDYLGVMKSDLGDWCDFELDFIKKWWRDKKISELLNYE
jgi:hypothetical protein